MDFWKKVLFHNCVLIDTIVLQTILLFHTITYANIFSLLSQIIWHYSRLFSYLSRKLLNTTWFLLTNLPIRTIRERNLLDCTIVRLIKTSCLILCMFSNFTRLVIPLPLVIKSVYYWTFIFKSWIFQKQLFLLYNN